MSAINKPMSTNDLRSFCKKINVEFNIIDLKELNENYEKLDKKYYFIYTGSENNEYNKGNTHHFFIVIGNHYFDSYGNVEGLIIPESIKRVVTSPKQLQEFYEEDHDSVCGEYCCLFLKTFEENQEKPIQEIAKIFVEEYGLGKDKHENDEIIFKEFREIK